ncbi:leucine-rich repeat extensin-like protein 5 [Mercurialis annua]|uniref:leucine-rich repeat extensin-like protein 5 n=1 Tax=Mercurialis annua TaxID=3986 RepID=UPI002160E4C3|nr:leucine-rich repeat extensin-like protein 5 [Mercurialis annua]
MEVLKKRKTAEGSDGSSTQEYLRSLLDPLNKFQLVDLLLRLGSQYPSIAEEIKSLASADPVHRKLFVRGLAWNAASETLCAAFREHGEIEEGAVIYDKETGISRGFGFITYKHIESTRSALKAPRKLINGRFAVCNLACEGFSGASTSPDLAQRRLYVWGLSPEVSTEMLLSFFGRHGEIKEGSVAYDKETNKSRGFGFVTYKTVEAAKRAIDDPLKLLGGRSITVKLADTKHKGKTAQTPAPLVPVPGPDTGCHTQSGKAHPAPDLVGYSYPQNMATFPGSSYPSHSTVPTAPYPPLSQYPNPLFGITEESLGTPAQMGIRGSSYPNPPMAPATPCPPQSQLSYPLVDITKEPLRSPPKERLGSPAQIGIGGSSSPNPPTAPVTTHPPQSQFFYSLVGIKKEPLGSPPIEPLGSPAQMRIGRSSYPNPPTAPATPYPPQSQFSYPLVGIKKEPLGSPPIEPLGSPAQMRIGGSSYPNPPMAPPTPYPPQSQFSYPLVRIKKEPLGSPPIEPLGSPPIESLGSPAQMGIGGSSYPNPPMAPATPYPPQSQFLYPLVRIKTEPLESPPKELLGSPAQMGIGDSSYLNPPMTPATTHPPQSQFMYPLVGIKKEQLGSPPQMRIRGYPY